MNENFDFRNIRSNALGDYDDSDRLKSLCEQSFFSCNFYENFYKFYKEILVSKMFKYKIFQTGTTTTLLYDFSKIIENEIAEPIDYSNVYDSTILSTNQLNVQATDKILFVEDIVFDNFNLSSDILLLEKKYNVPSSNIFVASLVDKKMNYRNVYLYSNNFATSFAKSKEASSIEILLEINRFGKFKELSGTENKILLELIRQVNECICSNMNADEYYYPSPETYDCDALYYWNKSNVISVNYLYPFLFKNYEFNFEFYPTLKLEDFKKFLIENQLVKVRSVDELSNNELKAIFDLIMLNKYQENKLKGCSYLYSIQDFDYEKFNQMNIHASDFDKYIDENKKFYGEFITNCNVMNKFNDSISSCTYANGGYNLIADIGGILMSMDKFNEQCYFPEIFNRNGEYIVKTKAGTLPIHTITYLMKESYYPEQYYFLVLTHLTRMYKKNHIDIKADIFKDFDKNLYIGPAIDCNKNHKNLWHHFDSVDTYGYRITDKDFEIEKEKAKVKNLK